MAELVTVHRIEYVYTDFYCCVVAIIVAVTAGAAAQLNMSQHRECCWLFCKMYFDGDRMRM